MKKKLVVTIAAYLIFLTSCAEPVAVEDVVDFLQSESSDLQDLKNRGFRSEFGDSEALSASNAVVYKKVVRSVNQTTSYMAIFSASGATCERSVWLAANDAALMNLTQIRTALRSDLEELINTTYVNASEFLPDRVYFQYRVKRTNRVFYLTYSPNEQSFGGRHGIGFRYIRDITSKECLTSTYHIAERLRASPELPITKAPIPTEFLMELRRARWLPPQ
jgi:hypothetical protein